jgi:hypothetical protein
MKPEITIRDQSRTFVNLLGFETQEAWEKFSNENKEEGILIGAHFNFCMKNAVEKCKNIINWKKFDIRKYNTVKKRSTSPTTKAIIKHPKLDNFEWKTVMDSTVPEIPFDPRTRPPPTTSDSHTQTDLNVTSMELYEKEKKTMESIIQNQMYQIHHLQQLNGTYQNNVTESNHKFKILHTKFQATYLEFGKILSDTNVLIKKK